jgi:hypothetical protein
VPTPPESEPITIGLSHAAHGKLQRLKEDGHFTEMTDGYRFAIALAIAHGVSVPKLGGSRTTIFNVGSLDPDRSIHLAVSALREDSDEPVYRTAERLAEWGVEELFRRVEEQGRLSVAEILAEAESLAEM